MKTACVMGREGAIIVIQESIAQVLIAYIRAFHALTDHAITMDMFVQLQPPQQ